ncbi:hypothetical protein EON64_19165, partial [archaeon]
MSSRPSNVWVIYTIHDPLSPVILSTDGTLNALAIPYHELVGTRQDALLIDLYTYFLRHPPLRRLFLDQAVAVRVLYGGQYMSLPSLLCPLPIQPDGTLRLELQACGHG